MKILLLTFNFPPQAPLAATRAPKFAKYLVQQGHDVRVLCADDPQPFVAHRLEVDPSVIIRTSWQDKRAVPRDVVDRIRLRSSANQHNGTVTRTPPPPIDPLSRRSIRTRISDIYDSAFCRPDGKVGWKAPAMRAARELFSSWRPDVIYATCPPHSTAVIAESISRHSGVPFIAEFRDRWGLNAYSQYPDWRQSIDLKDEQGILTHAAGIVTVSPEWVPDYEAAFGKERVALSMNGFDPEEYPTQPPAINTDNADRLELLYAGALYPGRREPTPIFEAIARLGEDAANVHVTMLGKDLDLALWAAADAGIEHNLTILPTEPHDAIIRRQYNADLLLMLQWNHALDSGTIPGKLFECIGARRPIIATGWPDGVVANLVKDRQLGLFSNNRDEIAQHLRQRIAEKRKFGRIAPLPAMVRDGFSRDVQFSRIMPLLDAVSNGSKTALAGEQE